MDRGWEGIEEFVAIANAGSFTAAAGIHGTSVTHMSRAVARLESRISAQLLTRTTRTVRLTDTGRVFLDHCQRIIQDRDEAFAMISEDGEPQGDLRITCSTALGELFLAPIVRRYCEQYPKIQVSIELTNRLVDLIAEGYDLAVRTGTLSDNRLIGTQIASRTLLTCAAPHYLEQNGRPQYITDLNTHQCLPGSAMHWHFRFDGQEQLYRPNGRWRCNSGAAVAEAAMAGMGICQLPEFYILPHIATGALELVLDGYRADNEPIWAVYSQRRHLLPKISRLVSMISMELPLALQEQ